MNIVALSECCEFIKDGTHNTPEKVSRGIPVLSAGNVYGGQLSFETNRFATEEELAIFRKRLHPKIGDVLLTIVGTIGRAAVLTEDQPLIFQRSVCVLRPRSDLLDSLYFRYALESEFVQKQFEMEQQGVAQMGIYLETLNEIKLPFPPLAEQQQIASLLMRADHLRQLRSTADDLGDALLQSLFLEMFGDPLINDKGWNVVKLSEAFAIKPQIGTPNPAHAGGKYLVIRVGEIGNKKVELESSQRITLDEKELERFRLKSGDFLLARAIGSEDHLGKASILQDTNQVIVYDSHVMRLRFDPKIMSPVFFWHWLKSDAGRARFMQRAGRTAVQFNVNAEQIADINIPLPPLSLQEEFAGVVARVEGLRGRMSEAGRQVNGLFESLLSESFRS